MKERFLIITLIVFIFSAGILFFVNPGQTKVVAEDSEAAEIRGILEKYYEIARTKDREAIKNFSREITAPEYLYSSEKGVLSKTETLQLFDSVKPDYLNAGFNDLTIQVHGNTAIAKYRDVSNPRQDGGAIVEPLRFTNVWVKRDGKWLIVAEHSSRETALRELIPKNRFLENLAAK